MNLWTVNACFSLGLQALFALIQKVLTIRLSQLLMKGEFTPFQRSEVYQTRFTQLTPDVISFNHLNIPGISPRRRTPGSLFLKTEMETIKHACNRRPNQRILALDSDPALRVIKSFEGIA